MKEMSKFLSAFATDPEEQRFSKAVVHLRSLVFSPLSDDHVLALALLYELGKLYAQAFGTDHVLQPSAQRGTQEEALSAHLNALGLPSRVAELEPQQIEALVSDWETRSSSLPRPFDRTVQTFVLHAKTHLSAAQPYAPALPIRRANP